MKLSNQPPKGTSDWLPEEFRIRKYIFDTWREVCEKFGYEEYLTPIIESADVYRAKSGEDVGGKELMTMEDRAGRELAIRPEMTPSVTRMVSKIYNDTPKPIRLFSIANYLRNEKPQRGRNREFWQLNFDIFGSESINADIEIIQMGVEIMNAYNADRSMYKVLVNDKNVLSDIIKNYLGVSGENVAEAVRIIDKYGKISNDELRNRLEELGANPNEWDSLFSLLEQKEGSINFLKENNYISGESIEKVETIISKLNTLVEAEIVWSPSLARGFDYYDGMVFEVFDKNPENNRAMFGGGRYNGLASLFGGQSFPAVGCAPGDETMKLFLEAWNLLPDFRSQISDLRYFVPLLDESLGDDINSIAKALRQKGKNVELGLEVQKFGKALDYANRKNIRNVVIFGTDEKSRGIYKIKDMGSGEEKEIEL